MVFGSEEEAQLAYENGMLSLQAKISVRRTVEFEGEMITGRTETTLGRIIFNSIIPQDLGLVDRTKKENAFTFEVNEEVKKGLYKKLIETCYRKHGTNTTVTMIDDIKNMGYKYSTLASVSFSIFDLTEANEREEIIAEADKQVNQNDELYMQGFTSYEEKKSKNMAVWEATTDKIIKATAAEMDEFNPLKIILTLAS